MDQPIRLGVLGTGRGKAFMHPADCTGFKLCAICDTNQERLNPVFRREHYNLSAQQELS